MLKVDACKVWVVCVFPSDAQLADFTESRYYSSISHAFHVKPNSGQRNESLTDKYCVYKCCNAWWLNPRRSLGVTRQSNSLLHFWCLVDTSHKAFLFKLYTVPQEFRWNRLGCRHPAHKTESYVKLGHWPDILIQRTIQVTKPVLNSTKAEVKHPA